MSEAPMTATPYADALKAGLTAGDRRALSRIISLVEAGDEIGEELVCQVAPVLSSLVVGFTGAPGAGKSTLINAYIGWLRAGGRRVAVLAVDPSSPLTGGAILGDRIRMIEHLGDPGVFVRSLATRGHLGGLTATVDKVLAVVDAAGWDVIILETVGTGQSETDVSAIADASVLIVAPGHGDEVQAMKAGVLETANIIVVNKNDMPEADRAFRHMSEMTRLAKSAKPAVIVQTTATAGKGLAELGSAIDQLGSAGKTRSAERIRRRIMMDLERRMRLRLVAIGQGEAMVSAVDGARTGALTIAQAVELLQAELLAGDVSARAARVP